MRDKLDHALRHYFKTELRFAHRHLLAVFAGMLVLGIVLGYGLFVAGERSAAQRYTAAYFATHTRLVQPHAPLNRLVPSTLGARSTRVPIPPAHVTWAYVDGVDNQGYTGLCECFVFKHLVDFWENRRRHKHRHLSCRFWGAILGQGQDNGAWLGQYPVVLAGYGAATSKEFGFRGTPSDPLDWPLPASVYRLALARRYQLKLVMLQSGFGGGRGAVLKLAQYMHTHRVPMNLAGAVFAGPGSNGYLDVNQNGGFIDIPAGNAVGAPNCPTGTWFGGVIPTTLCLVGFHAMEAVEVDPKLCHATSAGRTCGFVKVQNSWGPYWGLTRLGRARYGHGGYAYVSFRFIKRWIEEIDGIALTRTQPQGGPVPPWHQPGPAFDKPLPPPAGPSLGLGQATLPPAPAHLPSTCCSGDWVYGVHVNDMPGDFGQTINDAAHAYHISAPGLLSTLFAECGLFTQSPRCDRWGFWPDVSFGWCQVTVQTAGGFGVGGGSYAVRAYEDVVKQCIWLAARVLGSYKGYEARVGCTIDFPNLYVAWNAGPANPCWWLYAPSGLAGSNYYGNYLANWQTAQRYAVPYNPYGAAPPPPPVVRHRRFPGKPWEEYRRRHHKRYIGHTYKGQLTQAAQVWWQHRGGRKRGCRGILHREQWDAKNQVMTTSFERCWIWTYPTRPSYQAVLTYRHHAVR